MSKHNLPRGKKYSYYLPMGDEPVPVQSAARPISPAPETSNSRKNDNFYPAWDSFLATSPNRATKTSAKALKTAQIQAATASDPLAPGLNVHEPVSTSYDQAASQCRAKVAAIVEECKRLNQKYRDPLFDIESSDDNTLQSLDGRVPGVMEESGTPPWVKRVEDIFENPSFFVDGPTADDVIQGSGGDCWFLAALMSITAKTELVDKLCVARDEKCGVYGFVFYRDGEWVPEVVDDRLYIRVGDLDDIWIVKDPETQEKGVIRKSKIVSVKYDEDKLRESLQKGGTALFFARCRASETWLPLIEKAYAKAHGDYKSIEGGYVGEGIEDLTGGVGVAFSPEDIMDRNRFWADLLQVNKTYLFGASSMSEKLHGVVGSHAYCILETYEEGSLRLIKMKNPWGEEEWDGAWSDGSDKWTPEMMTKLKHKFGDDGIFWMSYEDFLKHYALIYRTRLFGPEWTVTQRWTSVNVPWTPDYLDTKFELAVTQPGPLAIVLFQPDDRYFKGLKGRHDYALHFRVYSNGKPEKYVVRSMSNSGGYRAHTRSVSAEVDLEPGVYSVVVKVTPDRYKTNMTAEEMIKAQCTGRKQKLLSVGRNFDIAMSKGKLREKEKANTRAARRDERDKVTTRSKKDRTVKKMSKEKAEKRKQRIKNAVKEMRLQRRPGPVTSSLEDNPLVRNEDNEPVLDAAPAPASDAVLLEKSPTVDAGPENAMLPAHHQDKGQTPIEDTRGQTSESPDSRLKTLLTSLLADKDLSADLLTEATSLLQDLKIGAGQLKPPPSATHSSNAADSLDSAVIHDKIDDSSDASATTPETSSSEDTVLIDPVKPPTNTHGDASPDVTEVKREHLDSSAVPTAEQAQNQSTEEEADDESEEEIVLDDDDFEWDSEIDGSVVLSDEEEGLKDLHEDDPWNAVCVLGLRVYSLDKGVKVDVVEGG